MMHARSRLTGWLMVLVPLLFALDQGPLFAQGGSSCNIVVNGSFEQPDAGANYVTKPAGSVFGNWTVEAGSVDQHGTFWQAASGRQSVDMSGLEAGTMYQDLATTPGQTYQLRFALAGNPDGNPVLKSLEVWWGSSLLGVPSFDVTGHSRATMGWRYQEYLVVASSTVTRLRFRSQAQSAFGPELDDVSVTPVGGCDPGGGGGSPCSSVVTNGSFEQPDAGATWVVYGAGQSFGSWIVDAGSVEHLGAAQPAAHGRQSVDMSGLDAGSIYQDLPTTAGQSYRLRFAMGGNFGGPPVQKSMEVWWGATQVARLQSTRDMGWRYYEFTLAASTSTTRLRFTSLDHTVYGPELDDVSVIPFPCGGGGGNGGAPGTITTIAGTGADASFGDGGPAVQAGVRTPHGLAFDATGNLFVAEYRGDRVRMVTREGLIRTIAGTGVAGFSGDGGPATSAMLSAPWHLAADTVGNLIITDQDNYRVRRIDRNGIIVTIVGTGRPGFSGDNGPGWRAEIDRPWGVALTPIGTLYLAANNRVRQMDSDGTIHPFAGSDIWESGGDNGPFWLATFRTPGGLTRDRHGNVYITELQGHRVRKVTVDGVIHTVAGTGAMGSSGDGGPATAAPLNVPYAVAVDTADNLFIADTYGHRVRMVSPDGIIRTVAGTGAPGYSGDGGPATQAQLNYPAGLAIDGRGDLYIADWGNHRVRKVAGVAAPGLVAGTPLPRP